MRLAAESGDGAQRLRAFEETAALARATAGLGSMLAWLTAPAVGGLVVGELLEGLLLYPVDDDAWLAAADAALARDLVAHYPAAADMLGTEHAAALDHIQRIYDRDDLFIPLAHARLVYPYDISKASADLLPFGDSRWSNIHRRRFLGRQKATAWLEQAYRLAIESANATGPGIAAADAALQSHYDAATWRNPARDIGLEPLRLIEFDRRERITRAGARVMLAIERYRLRHEGAVPPTLAALGDLLPDGLLVDPVTQQPWDYAPQAHPPGWEAPPLEPDQRAWPYALRSRPLPGPREESAPFPGHPSHGVLMTRPVRVVDVGP